MQACPLVAAVECMARLGRSASLFHHQPSVKRSVWLNLFNDSEPGCLLKLALGSVFLRQVFYGRKCHWGVVTTWYLLTLCLSERHCHELPKAKTASRCQVTVPSIHTLVFKLGLPNAASQRTRRLFQEAQGTRCRGASSSQAQQHQGQHQRDELSKDLNNNLSIVVAIHQKNNLLCFNWTEPYK